MWIYKADWERTVCEHAAATATLRRLETEHTSLLESVRLLSERCSEERIRAENAIDQMLAKSGGNPVTPTRVPDPNAYPGIFDEDPDELRTLRDDIKVHGMETVLKRSTEGA